MRALKYESIRRHSPGIICALSSALAGLSEVTASRVSVEKLVVYGAREFPEYHNWISKVLGNKRRPWRISQECTDVLSLIAAVESGRGVAIVGEFITVLLGDRVRFVPFASKAHSLDVGLLYRSGFLENHPKMLAAISVGKQSRERRAP